MFKLQNYSYNEFINLGLLKYAPMNKRILDVGCGSGVLGEAYRKKGNYVVGIDISATIKPIAKKTLDEFYCMDVTEHKKIEQILKGQLFDVIIFADILEHLYDPISCLEFYKQFLKKDGIMYISVPNFTVWYNRFHILFGNYQYTEVGTRDKTHIRMFTANTIKQVAKVITLSIVKRDITPGIAQAFITTIRKFFAGQNKKADKNAILNSKSYTFYTKYLYPVEYFICKVWPGMLAFQYIVLLKRKK